MIKSKELSAVSSTTASKQWPYEQYYFGEKDHEKRKNGYGENHWRGAKSLEWYTGSFLRDTMHGTGEYRWRHRSHAPDGVSITYEGQFYGDQKHGYGLMSYPDGRIFNGLFCNDLRYGPGVESHACLRANVGLWRGTQLVRLAWKPKTHMECVTVDLITRPEGRIYVEPYRTTLMVRTKIIGDVNSAIELLKQYGADPITASEKWTRLYPKHCNDLSSQLCHVEVFQHEYYKHKITELEEVSAKLQGEESSNADLANAPTHYAWNNDCAMVHMMKHTFKHEKQRIGTGLDLGKILVGPRKDFKTPGQYETDCRTLLMACYLGHIPNVVRLINESNVHPDIADNQGNTAVMYAVCGQQVDVVHFLAEAGANIDYCNDSCCTPLGVALLKLACAKYDIPASLMVQALIPPAVLSPHTTTSPTKLEEKPTDWHITRDVSMTSPRGGLLTRIASKTNSKNVAAKKIRSSFDNTKNKKTDTGPPATEPAVESSIIYSGETQQYYNINIEFCTRVTNLFSTPNGTTSVPYLFEVNDMIKEMLSNEGEQKKPPEKLDRRNVSKVIKDTIKPSKEIIWQNIDDDNISLSSVDKIKVDMVSRMKSTVLQLLEDGADPRKVRCPQPALMVAIVSGCSDLVRELVNHGADVNEVYPNTMNYTALDVAVSKPLTYENLDMIRVLLECGASPDHRLVFVSNGNDSRHFSVPDPSGPTLLHAVLAKRIESETEEDIRRQVLELLLEYGCDAVAQFKGHSAVEEAMLKSMDLLDVFIKCPKTDLNAIINDSNQTLLVKMFSSSFCKTVPLPARLQTLTNLLLFGADPLLECQSRDDEYKNLFEYAVKLLTDLDQGKSSSPIATKVDMKSKKEKPKKDDKPKSSVSRAGADDSSDYKLALDLVTECARILHVRWLQAKLLKELIGIVTKYEHRQWNMILPEHKNKKSCGLWLSCPRSLEIWNILKPVKKQKFRRILKHVLCMVQFYCLRSNTSLKWPLTAEEKELVEKEVNIVLQEYKGGDAAVVTEMPWVRPYVTPELFVGAEEKFQVCFECSIPFGETKITCVVCKQVTFCSLQCLKTNMDRSSCHPCSATLKLKYYPATAESSTLVD